MDVKYEFKPGDIVFCIDAEYSNYGKILPKTLHNKLYTVSASNIETEDKILLKETESIRWYASRFILAKDVTYLDELLLSSDP